MRTHPFGISPGLEANDADGEEAGDGVTGAAVGDAPAVGDGACEADAAAEDGVAPVPDPQAAPKRAATVASAANERFGFRDLADAFIAIHLGKWGR